MAKTLPLILAVDDAKAVRVLVAQALTGFACEIAESTNGYNALFAMEKALPDLILLDVSMPVMNGLELLEMLKSKPALAAIPVIMLTSPADRTLLPQLAAMGAAGTLMKPFNQASLIEAIGRVLNLAPVGK